MRSPVFTSIIIAIISSICFNACERGDETEREPPVANFSYSSVRGLPVSVQFTNTSVATGAATYVWDFGDGSTGTSNNPVHQYVQYGVYLVKLVQIESSGARDTVAMTLNISPNGPSGTSSRTSAASFTITRSDPYVVTFTNNSTNATSYLWEFGDGTTSTSSAATVSKSYTGPGSYHVRLTANNNAGTDTTGTVINF